MQEESEREMTNTKPGENSDRIQLINLADCPYRAQVGALCTPQARMWPRQGFLLEEFGLEDRVHSADLRPTDPRLLGMRIGDAQPSDIPVDPPRDFPTTPGKNPIVLPSPPSPSEFHPRLQQDYRGINIHIPGFRYRMTGRMREEFQRAQIASLQEEIEHVNGRLSFYEATPEEKFLQYFYIQNKKHIAVSGAPGSGKDTLINRLSDFRFLVVPETATLVYNANPELRNDGAAFQREIFNVYTLQRELVKKIAGQGKADVLFNRTELDQIIYHEHLGLPLLDELKNFDPSVYDAAVFCKLPAREAYLESNHRPELYDEAVVLEGRLLGKYQQSGLPLVVLDHESMLERIYHTLQHLRRLDNCMCG